MLQPDRGPLLNVGTCIDCRSDIQMYEDERKFYDDLVATREGFVFPKRCKPCIIIKKKKIAQRDRFRELAGDVRQMSDKAIEGQYDGHADTLAQELSDLAAKMEQLTGDENANASGRSAPVDQGTAEHLREEGSGGA